MNSLLFWISLGVLTWLAVVALILACARTMRMPEHDAQEAVDSCKAALDEAAERQRMAWAGATEVRRRRAGSAQ